MDHFPDPPPAISSSVNCSDPGVGVLCALQQQLWAVYVHENPQVIDPDFNEEHHSFLKVLVILGFMSTLFVGGLAMKALKGSPLLAEILVGVIFGPQLLDIVPEVEAFELIGKLGVMMLVLESGIHIDVTMLKKVGARSFVIAVVGTLLPVILGFLVMLPFGFSPWPDCVVIGSALAPTSLGMATKLLKEVSQLDSPMGQMITTAAVIDDVLSLLVLAELSSLVGDDVSFWILFSPILYSVLFLIGGGILTLVVPKLLPKMLDKIPKENHMAREYFLLFALFSFAIAMAFVAGLATSFLLGTFLAGVAFSTMHETYLVWQKQVKRIAYWLARFFFAASIGFVIPVREMFTPEAILSGLVLASVAILGKVATGLFAKPLSDGWKIGWAMTGRGEFAFVIVQVALEQGLVDQVGFATAVWGLLISSLLAPFVFRYVLWKDAKRQMLREANRSMLSDGSDLGVTFGHGRVAVDPMENAYMFSERDFEDQYRTHMEYVDYKPLVRFRKHTHHHHHGQKIKPLRRFQGNEQIPSSATLDTDAVMRALSAGGDPNSILSAAPRRHLDHDLADAEARPAKAVRASQRRGEDESSSMSSSSFGIGDASMNVMGGGLIDQAIMAEAASPTARGLDRMLPADVGARDVRVDVTPAEGTAPDLGVTPVNPVEAVDAVPDVTPDERALIQGMETRPDLERMRASFAARNMESLLDLNAQAQQQPVGRSAALVPARARRVASVGMSVGQLPRGRHGSVDNFQGPVVGAQRVRQVRDLSERDLKFLLVHHRVDLGGHHMLPIGTHKTHPHGFNTYRKNKHAVRARHKRTGRVGGSGRTSGRTSGAASRATSINNNMASYGR